MRDHLSHGEISLNEFPREIANQILGFAIILLCRFSEEEEFVTLKVGANVVPGERLIIVLDAKHDLKNTLGLHLS